MGEKPGINGKGSRIFHDSNGIWGNWENGGNGSDYISWLSERGRSDLFNASVLLFGDDVSKVLRKYSEEYGWGEVPNLLTKDDITEEQKQRVKDKYSSTGWYQKLKEERPGTLLQSTIVESAEDVVNGVVDSYIVDKSAADFSDNFVSDVLREVKYAYNYPERNYSTVTTPSLLYLLRAEARQSTDFTDFVLRAEENYGLDGEEFDLEDLQNIFDDVNALPMQDQNVGTLEAPNVNIEDKAEQFTEILSSKSNFEEFLNALRNAKNLDGASLFINNLLASLNDNNTLTTDGFRIAYGQVLESPELYMDLYAQATGNTYWQSSEIAGGEISEEMSSE